jgi:hypothetical protein
VPIRNYGTDWSLSSSMLFGKRAGLWGKRPGAEPVDFQNQIGIYALQSNGKVVYIGRSGVGPNAGILSRLQSHHFADLKKGKWDTFSWFGFRPVTKSGALYLTPRVNMETSDVISDIEALLIGLIHPKLNSKSGKHKHIAYYDQVSPEKLDYY